MRMVEVTSALKKLSGRKYVLMTGNATTSLYLSLKSLKLKPRSQIMIPNISCHHVPLSIFLSGHVPLLVDIDKSNFGLSLKNIKKNFNSKVKAILAIHSFGKICKINQIENFCKRKNIHLIEDSALSLGTKSEKKPVGSFGISSVFSFGKGKVIDADGGGAIVTDDNIFFQRVKELYKKLKKKNKKSTKKIQIINDNHTKIYNNFFIEDQKSKIKDAYKKKVLIDAKNLLHKFDNKILRKLKIDKKNIKKIVNFRKKNFFYLNKKLKILSKNFFTLPNKLKKNEIPWRYNIFFKNEAHRNHILKKLLENKLKVSSWHPRLDLFFGGKKSHFPVADYLSNKILNIWINEEINKVYLDRVINLISKEKLKLR